MSKIQLSGVAKRNVVQFDRSKHIFINGLDNAYPQKVERMIQNSVTADACVKKATSFIVGDGFVDKTLNEKVVYNDGLREYTMYDILQKVSKDVVMQGGFSLGETYNGLAEVSKIKPIPYKYVRIGKTDSQDYSGFYFVYNNWEKDTHKGAYNINKAQKIHTFNPNPEIVLKQMAGTDYSGQLALFVLDDTYIYPLAPIDASLEDADTESLTKTFKNGEMRKGFFGKKIVYHTAFESKADEEAFKQTLRQFEGADCDARTLMIESEFDDKGELKQESAIKLENLELNFNDKVFEYTEKSTANNIRKSFWNIPSILVEQQDSGFFGSSGEAIANAFKVYNQDTKMVRDFISSALEKVMKHSQDEYLKKAKYDIKQLEYGI